MSTCVDSRFLTALRLVELDRQGAPIGPVEHHAQMSARVELEPWEPQFEITERMLVTPEDAADLSLHFADHARPAGPGGDL